MKKNNGFLIGLREWTTFGIMFLAMLLTAAGCGSDETSEKKQSKKDMEEMKEGTFGYDVQFLKQHTDIVVLENKAGTGKVLVTPKMQGRVMTSTLEGDAGKSLGWVNRELIESGEIKEHFTPYGGEDRFWIGPEGGQYSVFISPGKEMTFENWYVPSGFNTEPWNPVAKSDTHVTVEKKLTLTNYSDNQFDLRVNRSVQMIDESRTEDLLGVQIPDAIKQVAFETENTIQNTGKEAWTQETGGLSIWILSMFTPAPGVTVAIPYKEGPEKERGPIVTTEYFGEISPERLKIEEGMIYFKVDGKKRRKLGVSPQRALPVAGSYDETNDILTVIQYTFPEDKTAYVNQLWKHQENPYKGNIVYAYNDGPLEDGSQLGPFYELESSSPAAFLKPGERLTHDHRVFHFTGEKSSLDRLSREILGVGLDKIASAF